MSPTGNTLVVDSVEDITPGMRRVHFAGHGVAAYLAAGPYLPNIKLYFPVPGQPLDFPEREASGHGFAWGPGQRERVRTYTVRSADPATSRMAIDFVRHGDEGLASAWAERAAPGTLLGAFGGGGLVVGEAGWVLLAGDETALPAIGLALEGFPRDQRGLALIEIADDGERQDLCAPAGVEVRWLSREGRPAGTTTLLQQALEAVEFPAADFQAADVRAWVSAESEVVKHARRHLKTRGFNRRHHLIIGYWHRGTDEPTYARATDHDRVAGELRAYLPGQEDDHEEAHTHDHAAR